MFAGPRPNFFDTANGINLTIVAKISVGPSGQVE